MCCVVCLTLLASFFLPSHLSFKNMYMVVVVTVSEYRVSNAILYIQGGTTPLMAASWNGHVETVDLLLCSGANINQTNVSVFIHVV